jgi:hypothetical protein
MSIMSPSEAHYAMELYKPPANPDKADKHKLHTDAKQGVAHLFNTQQVQPLKIVAISDAIFWRDVFKIASINQLIDK